MSFLKDALNAELAKFRATQAKLVPTPQAPFGYGRDLSCTTDLTADMAETDPNSPRGILESCIRFLTTDRDTIPDAPGRGWNLNRLINHDWAPSDVDEWQGLARGEVEQDDRIDRADLAIELLQNLVRVRLKIWPKSNDAEPFAATFALDSTGAVFVEQLSKVAA